MEELQLTDWLAALLGLTVADSCTPCPTSSIREEGDTDTPVTATAAGFGVGLGVAAGV